jgi:hypothetical protein
VGEIREGTERRKRAVRKEREIFKVRESMNRETVSLRE